MAAATFEEGRKILTDLENQLRSVSDIAKPWLRQIESLKARSPTKVIIGVVGATGSGKSSIINAILGENQLIPTNCMRACTAVVTEISWNNENGDHEWRANVEFVSKAEWRKELENLLGDIETSVGSIHDEESEAGIAFAKITAVYPSINKDNITKVDAEELLQKPEVFNFLNSEVELEAKTAEGLHSQLKRYIDSQEKPVTAHSMSDEELNDTQEIDNIAYWPMIRRVRIFAKASVLRSGCVIVDLPGIADSNAARSVVARRYLRNCTAIWVVAPIIRAVDDKSARYLLGEGFRRQLARDGTLERVTFICSKTDEINIREARSVLDRDPEFLKISNELDTVRQNLGKDRARLTQTLNEVSLSYQEASDSHALLFKEEQSYRKLRDIAAAGVIVHPPVIEATRKRKCDHESTTQETPKKTSKLEQYKLKTLECPSNHALSPAKISESFTSADFNVQQDTSLPPLTPAAIESKIEEIKLARLVFRDARQVAYAQKSEHRQELLGLKEVKKELQVNEWQRCVTGRNNYATESLRKDFAAGLNDLHFKDEDEEDEATESNALAQTEYTLPVFCVSTQGYQKLRGELTGEQSAAVFANEADTGIPSLQEHVFQQGLRQMALDQQGLNDEAQRLLTSLRLWSEGSGDSETLMMTDDDNNEIVEEIMDELKQSITATVSKLQLLCEGKIQRYVYEMLPIAAAAGSVEALTTVQTWGASVKSDEPGICWSTYKAIARRNGSHKNPRKAFDFTADLLQPYMRYVDPQWATTFNTSVPGGFSFALAQCQNRIYRFETDFDQVMRNHYCSGTARGVFSDQVGRFATSMCFALETAKNHIKTEQQSTSLLFTESVDTVMRPIYPVLTRESGQGSFVRMKRTMKQHVTLHRDTMFTNAGQAVQTEIDQMLSTVFSRLKVEVEAACDSMKLDCTNVISSRGRDFGALDHEKQYRLLAAISQALENFNDLEVNSRERLGHLTLESTMLG